MTTVLILDDSVLVREHLRSTLRDVGIHAVSIDEARDLASARRALERANPDLAFVDLGLPDGHGADIIPEIAARNPRAFVAAMSALPRGSPEVMEALSAGARAYLQKPITPAALRDAFEETHLIDHQKIRRIPRS